MLTSAAVAALLSLSAFAQTVADKAVADSKPIAQGSEYAANARDCLKAVATARAWAESELGTSGRWLEEPVTCEVASDDGCGSAMWDHDLQFLTGKPGHCGRAASIPAYVYHEWAHGLNHEFAGVHWQTLDEALADTFAIYLTGNPRFGQGMFLDREISWQRDLSDRKIYDGETKELYTQSETLSGSWWDFRVKLVAAFGQTAGAALAKSVYFQHLRELSAAQTPPKHTDDYQYARQAVEDVPAVAGDAGRHQIVACALFNAFFDHGLADGVEPGCASVVSATTDSEIDALSQDASKTLTSSLVGGGSFPVTIVQKGSTVFQFKVSAAAAARVRALVLRARVVHPYSEDLLLRVTAPDGKTRHDIYKGEEELAVPQLITDRYKFSGARAAGVWKIELISLDKGTDGNVEALSLTLVTK